MIYLASPYGEPEPLVRNARYEAACDASETGMARALPPPVSYEPAAEVA